MADLPDYNHSYVAGKEKIAHLFGGQHREERSRDRLPPGQRLVSGFPVLDLGIRPTEADLAGWILTIDGAVDAPKAFSLEELKALPATDLVKDFHCVTRWSSYDREWRGVLLRDLAKLVQVQNTARFIIFHSYDNYTTNVATEDALTDTGMVAWELDGDDLPILHGGPIRGLIPELYGWKSAKFLQRIEFSEDDQPGFWEVRGYNNHGDPWLEERYSE